MLFCNQCQRSLLDICDEKEIENFLFDHSHHFTADMTCSICHTRYVHGLKLISSNDGDGELVDYTPLLDFWMHHSCFIDERVHIQTIIDERDHEREEIESVMASYKMGL